MRAKFITSLLLVSVAITFICRDLTAQGKQPTTAKKPAAVAEAGPEIAFTVSMSKPSTHLLEVEMRLKWPEGKKVVDLKMPVWTPGSYLIREYARHVQDFKTADAQGGSLTWQKIK